MYTYYFFVNRAFPIVLNRMCLIIIIIIITLEQLLYKKFLKTFCHLFML